MKEVYRNRFLSVVLALMIVPMLSKAQRSGATTPFYIGADLSFSPLLEKSQVDFYDKGSKAKTLDIFKSYGWNLVRLKLWHTNTGVNGLGDVLRYAQRVKQKKMSFLLDIFYSDTWADISKQPSPREWTDLSKKQLQDSIYQYTYRVISTLKANNAIPDIVQIGNEINHGILWDNGVKINGINDSNWNDFAILLNKAISGVRAADPQHNIKIMIPYGGINGADEFYQKLNYSSVPYDLIGLSYYPAAPNNNLTVVQQQLTSLSNSLNKDIMLVETAYPYTQKIKDESVKQSLGPNARLIENFPISPEGQKNFLLALRTLLKKLPKNHGIGFCYWAPDWVAYNGPKTLYVPYKSSWQNQTLFDLNNQPLPALKAFKN